MMMLMLRNDVVVDMMICYDDVDLTIKYDVEGNQQRQRKREEK